MDEICEDQIIDYLSDLTDRQRLQFLWTIQNHFCTECGNWFEDAPECSNPTCPTYGEDKE